MNGQAFTGPVARLALALHEADLDGRCKARGRERALHIAAYRKTAESVIEDLSSRWQPTNPPADVLAGGRS